MNGMLARTVTCGQRLVDYLGIGTLGRPEPRGTQTGYLMRSRLGRA